MNIDDLVREYTQLADTITQLTERQNAIKAQLRTLNPGRHTTSYGVAVTVTPQRRFNAARAAAELPADVVAQCQDFSASKAKRVLAPALYEAFMDASGDPRVAIS